MLFESADVETMLRLLATVADPTVEMRLTDRKRRLLEGIGTLVGADAWAWFASQMNTDLRGDAAPFSSIDGGWIDEQERVKAMRVMVHPELMPIVTAPLHDAMLEQRSITRCRPQLICDDVWQSAVAGQTWRSVGFDHFIISAYPLGEAVISACGFYRRIGKSEFTEREIAIVHVMLQQIDWLHRAECDVPASDKVIDLSPRERQVVMLLIGGDSRKQVAAKLKISQHTVADYLKEIYRKFNVGSRAELMAKFIPTSH